MTSIDEHTARRKKSEEREREPISSPLNYSFDHHFLGERTNEMMDFNSKVFFFLLIFFVVQAESMDPCQVRVVKFN